MENNLVPVEEWEALPGGALADDLSLPRRRATKPINLQIRVDQHLLDRIQREADKKALPASAMARILIMERLGEIEGAQA